MQTLFKIIKINLALNILQTDDLKYVHFDYNYDDY